jgi:hypothetical protein
MSLLSLQRDFRGWLTDETPAPASKPGASIYQNNYRAQLLACLSDTFERVLLWLGEDAFRVAAATHIHREPPTGWTLDVYGAGFPETLTSLYPDDPEVAELAWLDLALARAFVGADMPPLSPVTLADVDWNIALLEFSPTLATRMIHTNAPAIWSAISAGDAPPAACLLPDAAALIVWRQDFTSCFRTSDAVEALALSSVIDGESFGTICAALVDRWGETDGIAKAGAILGHWLQDGIIVATAC